MAGWIGWFIKIDDTGANVGFQVALERRASAWDGCEMTGSNKYCNNEIYC